VKSRFITGISTTSIILLSSCASNSEDETPGQMVLPGIPTEQMAIVQTGNGGPEVLTYETIPVLEPGEGQVLIRVYAASVNPVDWKMRIGNGRTGGAQRRVPGFDVAGVVAKLGAGVTNVAVGDPVFSMIGRVQVDGLNGGYSHYVVAPASNVIAKPTPLTYAQAAGLGTVGYAAGRMMNLANVQPGQRVFIDGIAGGVGSTAAQMAVAQGAYVIGTASTRHHDYLYSIGVDEPIDYRNVRFEDVITKPVDVVIETVGVETATRALKILKRGGILVSVVGTPSPELVEAAGVRVPDLGRPGEGMSEGAILQQIGQLAEEGKLSIHVDATFPLEEAAAAQEENRDGGTEGKIILIVDPENANKG
jgi:NADPH:quinone reductase-like Zn-dependent oxidoreductase